MKRATCFTPLSVRGYHISIHALVKRATFFINGDENGMIISIHALVKRATHGRVGLGLVRLDFNPRPREEGDVVDFKNLLINVVISIHALVKRATRET